MVGVCIGVCVCVCVCVRERERERERIKLIGDKIISVEGERGDSGCKGRETVVKGLRGINRAEARGGSTFQGVLLNAYNWREMTWKSPEPRIGCGGAQCHGPPEEAVDPTL